MNKGSYYIVPQAMGYSSTHVYGSGYWYPIKNIGSSASNAVVAVSGTNVTINSTGSAADSSANVGVIRDLKSICGKITVANDNTTVTFTGYYTGSQAYKILVIIYFKA